MTFAPYLIELNSCAKFHENSLKGEGDMEWKRNTV